MPHAPWPRLGALAVVIENDQALLVLRGNEKPGAGLWGFPGGHVEPGETTHAAAARELLEETCLTATPSDTLMHLDVIARDVAGALLYHYLLVAVRCITPQGTLQACDDAADARWIPVETILLGGLPVIENVDTVLTRALTPRADAP